MRKYFYASLLLALIALCGPATAQVNVSINIGSQPTWGPSGYDYARFYYMPEIDVYYNVSNKRYTYFDGRRWVSTRSLPRSYALVDLYRTYKVVINDRDPWHQHNRYKKQYGRYAHNHSQKALKDYHKQEKKYYKQVGKQKKEQRKNWEKQQKHNRDDDRKHRR